MKYFNRRNNYQVEYSGYEEVSENLRERLNAVVNEYCSFTKPISYGVSAPKSIGSSRFNYAVQKEFPRENPISIIKIGDFYKVFTVIEILWDLLDGIQFERKWKAHYEITQSFMLSGSVYGIDSKEGRVVLIPEQDFAEKIKQTVEVLDPYDHAKRIFSEAVGNLFGRKAKPKDVVRDIYVAAEEYLKKITEESQYSSAIKKIHRQGFICEEQKNVLDKLYAFRSNTKGTTHAGDKDEVGEAQSVWFLDTMSAQLRFIHNKMKV